MPTKYKRTVLTVPANREILNRLGSGEAVTKIASNYEIGTSTVCDIKGGFKRHKMMDVGIY